MERLSTGIKALDELMEGGIPKGFVVLLSGAPGTGKTIFSLQFLWEGIKNGEKVMYISFDEDLEFIKEQAKRFGWDFGEQELRGNARFVYFDMIKMRLEKETYLDIIQKALNDFQPERVVIDSLQTLANLPVSTDELMKLGLISELDQLMPLGVTPEILRKVQMQKLFSILRLSKSTTLLISPIQKGSHWFSPDHVSEFLADGIIFFTYLTTAPAARSLLIEKMRLTKHYEDFIPFEIGEKGVEIKKRV